METNKKGYNMLSRRALIKLNQDFDSEHDDMLLEYLEENLNAYEKIRTCEKVICAADTASSKIKETMFGVRNNMEEQSSKLIDRALDVAIVATGVLGKKAIDFGTKIFSKI